MKYIVERTSTYDQPCDEAYHGTYTKVDERSVSDPVKLSMPERENWYTLGANHRVDGKHIKRDFPDTCWFVDFATLDDLMAFIAKYGRCIVGPHTFSEEYPCIEIYDDYRE